MAFFDMPLSELQTYKPVRDEAADFDTFWKDTLEQARQYPLDAVFEPVDYGIKTCDVYDVTFSGYNGQRVKAWYVAPRQRSGKVPCIVGYIGYGGGRGFGFEHLLWPSAGYAYLHMDTRGQGTSWSNGDTADIPDVGANPSAPGFMTQGILDPKTYYYRRLFTDAARAVDVALERDEVDTDRIAATGGSQGGGITLAAAGLNHAVKVIMPDVPFLCHYRRATSIVDTAPYSEIVTFCKTHRDKIHQVFQTLSYFDGVNFAARTSAHALFSVGLMDTICPPSTVYAAYNHLAGSMKEMRIYEYNNHEGGGNFHALEKLKFMASVWG